MRVINRCFLNGSLSKERLTAAIIWDVNGDVKYYSSLTKSEYDKLVQPGDHVSTYTQNKWQTSVLKRYGFRK